MLLRKLADGEAESLIDQNANDESRRSSYAGTSAYTTEGHFTRTGFGIAGVLAPAARSRLRAGPQAGIDINEDQNGVASYRAPTRRRDHKDVMSPPGIIQLQLRFYGRPQALPPSPSEDVLRSKYG